LYQSAVPRVFCSWHESFVLDKGRERLLRRLDGEGSVRAPNCWSISESGARCAVRDTGAHGMERYLWTVTVFGDHQLMEGRIGELTEARSQAETALSAYVRQARVV